MHFPIIVVGEDVEGQLAPFQENNMGDCPDKYLEKDDEGNTYNPNAMWDWYVIGGRWSGGFKLKPNKKGFCQPEILPGNRRKNFPNGVDSAIKGDIDFEGIKQYRIKLANKIWTRFMCKDNKYIRLTDEMRLCNKLGISPNETKSAFITRISSYHYHHIVWRDEWFGELSEKEYDKKLKEIGDKELLTIVDCHI